jgi:hypothetical protein
MEAPPLPGADDRIIETTRRVTPARVLGVLAAACALAAIFGSSPLLAWTESLPDGQAARLLHDAVVAWNNAMSVVGATRLHDWLRAFIRTAESFHF